MLSTTSSYKGISSSNGETHKRVIVEHQDWYARLRTARDPDDRGLQVGRHLSRAAQVVCSERI